MIGRRRVAFVVGICCCSSAGAAAPLTDHQEDAGELGNTLQYVAPVAALALTFLFKHEVGPQRSSLNTDELLQLNNSPRHDLALAVGRTFVVTQTLKYAFNETRPDGGSHSFPSGHTALAFTGAEFIRKEYGWRWGLPAYAVATYVGWSRVESREHYSRDVLAGAAIGILVNHDIREYHTRFGLLNLQFAPAIILNSSATGVSSAPGLQFTLAY
ncbi:MAG: phosphatase PAP2 family protein [Steroidobacteraceae bacterium]